MAEGKVAVSRSKFLCANFTSLLQNGGMEYVKREDPDIFCVQETKCQEADLPLVRVSGSLTLSPNLHDSLPPSPLG